jgi:predicted Zn-dependent protease
MRRFSRSLFDPDRLLTRPACEALFHQVLHLAPRGDTQVRITSRWRGTTRWVRNGLLATSDRVEQTLTVTRYLQGTSGAATTNQFDPESLQLAVALAEAQAAREPLNVDLDFVSGPRHYLSTPALFQPSTYAVGAADRAAVAAVPVAQVAAHGLLSAGYLETRAETLGVYDTQGLAAYAEATDAQCTTTVRDATGTAAGWAGQDHADWTRLDIPALSQRALDKCLAAANPIAIEPGRYTVILEPQATYALMRMAVQQTVMLRLDNEKSDYYPYNLRRAPRRGAGTAKFGMPVFDPRVSVSTDPLDPDAGYVPFDRDGTPYSAVTWIEAGVLRQLPYDLDFALERLGSGVAHPYTGAFRMQGGPTTVEAMVASMDRGIRVTRFTELRLIHARSLLVTGTTAGGTWLIEGGKATRAIKNLRCTTSPLEAFNQVEAIGAPERVYAPDTPAMVPAVKLRDFHFTSETDAI